MNSPQDPTEKEGDNPTDKDGSAPTGKVPYKPPFIDQSNLAECKERLVIYQDRWHTEAEMLKYELKVAKKALMEISEVRDEEIKRLGLDYHTDTDRETRDLERSYQMAWEWVWKIGRRQRELIRWEREELAYIERLEGNRKVESRANKGLYRPGERRPHPPRGKGNKGQLNQVKPQNNKKLPRNPG